MQIREVWGVVLMSFDNPSDGGFLIRTDGLINDAKNYVFAKSCECVFVGHALIDRVKAELDAVDEGSGNWPTVRKLLKIPD